MRKGNLFVVSTPIGNLKDITIRAIEVMKGVDIIVCEDSRRALKLINEYVKEKKKIIVYHDHNKEKVTPGIIKELNEGKDVALTTDAGTPVISDPGYYLIREAIKEDIRLIPVPGPSSILAALVVSGLAPDRWVFEGYLKKRKGRKRKQLERLKDETRTMIFFESPFRVIESLRDMKDILGNRRIALCRELTKIHEEIIRDRIDNVIEELSRRKRIKGEIVIVVEGKEKE